MLNIYVYCEGQTEETFVKTVLCPYFCEKNIYLYPILCRTKEGPEKIFKGGVTSYNHVIKEIKRYCSSHPNEYVTSFIDFYGLQGIPLQLSNKDKYDDIVTLENKMFNDVNFRNFIPYVSLHEFESLLFSKPEEFDYLSHDAVRTFNDILLEYNGNPELINNSPETAPSKRILTNIPKYGKVMDGTIIAQNISLHGIKSKCPHFSQWIDKLVGLGTI